jgi:dTDP-4-amino-4,6-dideoxygalactose transaminase
MPAQGVHKLTEQFEAELCKYTGSPYAVAVDNCSNAIFLALQYTANVRKGFYETFNQGILWMAEGRPITIPSHTYPAVPCEIIHAGCKVKFEDQGRSGHIRGSYQLYPTPVWDSALRFTAGMYVPGQYQCLSFTGPYKHLKLGKGGAILTDDEKAYKWFKKARFSGRDECSYHVDNFDDNPVVGWNFYMMPEIAARGLLLMQQFYNQDGTPKHNEDLILPYPDLSKYKIYQK